MHNGHFFRQSNGANGHGVGLLESSPVTVLVVHRIPLIRSGLKQILQDSNQFEVCGETDQAPLALELFVRNRPSIVVIGLTCRGGDGLALIKDFKKLDPTAKILVLSLRDDPLSLQRAFRAGAHGYVAADENISEVIKAMIAVAADRTYASPGVARRLSENRTTSQQVSLVSELNSLSDRELQVFTFIGRGFGVSRLANELHLSVKTIETHQMHIKRKLGLRSAAELSEKATTWALASLRRSLQLKKQTFCDCGQSAHLV